MDHPSGISGPAPPNETILEEAAQLALNLTEEIKQI